MKKPKPEPKPKRKPRPKPRPKRPRAARPGTVPAAGPKPEPAAAPPRPQLRPKSTLAEVRRRVYEVLKLRLGGAEFADLREYALAPEQRWDVSDGQLWRYVRAADRLCKRQFDAKAEHLLARHLLQRRQLYAHAMGAGDFRTALAVLQDEAKLEGLYPPTKIAPTNPNGDQEYAGGLTDADRAAALQRLYATLGARPGAAPAGGDAAAV
jgi:hypothetical protein